MAIFEGPRRARDQAFDETSFRLLVDSVRDYAIFMLDTSGRVATWNQGAERIKGYKPAEIIGQHFSRFYPEEDILANKPARELEEAARDGRFEDEGWRLRKDGSRFWANVVITTLRNERGEIVGFAKVTRDLTDRRLAEIQREEAARDATRSFEAINAFAFALASARTQAEVSTVIVDEGMRVMGADTCSLYVLDDARARRTS